VAIDEGRVIGTCRLLFRGNVARLGRLAVDPDRRGEGIAATLLALADRVAIEQGADSISLHAQTYARRLYLDAGYEERGPEFVEEGIEHVAMGKRLDASAA
jgi:predicted GNAT family N-acyltransferase